MVCSVCGSTRMAKYGHTAGGTQRYRCSACLFVRTDALDPHDQAHHVLEDRVRMLEAHVIELTYALDALRGKTGETVHTPSLGNGQKRPLKARRGSK